MSALKFSKLSLCSVNERSALQLSFDQSVTILVGGNGFGKSAVMKSLYDTLGAKPHKIDDSWKGARVTSLLEFTVDGMRYAALKSGKTYAIFDASNQPLIKTEHVTKELAVTLARLLQFELRMADKEDRVATPPPSYMFAPFYVDQDASWNAAWKSFNDFYLPDSPKNLAEYHSGLKPNDYYLAKAKHDLLVSELRPVEGEREEIQATLRRVRDAIAGAPIDFDIATFERETARLVDESQQLHDRQAKHRKLLGQLNEERTLWREQEAVVHAALSEMTMELDDAVHLHGDVECPMCGQHYHNKISDQFELVEDRESLIGAIELARSKISALDELIENQRHNVGDIEESLGRVMAALTVQKSGITLHDVVRAEGKAEAARILRAQLSEADEKYGNLDRRVQEARIEMDRFTSRERAKEINGYFAGLLRTFERELDVRADQARTISIRSPKLARGSEGPRGLLAFYFAFLATEKKFGSSTFCPIVIDAPNQQGQDFGHLKSMMEFMLKNVPERTQLIIAAETMPLDATVDVQEISSQKRAVLRQDKYEEVTEYVRPYLELMI
ncbi:MAG: hypothetical protein WAU68_17425 [Vitreimonas sp.]